jgi:hypothetical protein
MSGFAWVPFVTPLPGVWDVWYLLLIPMAACVAVAYKSLKVSRPSEIPKAATILAVWIVTAFVAAAVGLYLLVEYVAP